MTKARDLANGGFGLVLIKPSSVVGGTDNGKGTVSFSAQTTVSLNDVFNATYDNYRIVINALGTTNDPDDILIRLRVSNADNTNASYERVFSRINTAFGATQQGSQTAFVLGATSTLWAGASVDMMQPNLARRTHFYGLSAYNANSETGLIYGFFNADTVFTGFSLVALSGNITGTVSVYGYNK